MENPIANATKLGAAALVAALVLQLAFLSSYIGAFHKPTPHQVPIGVLATQKLGVRVAAQLNGIDQKPLSATVYKDRKAVKRALKERKIFGFVEPEKRNLYISSAANRATAVTLEKVFADIQSSRKQPQLKTVDLTPLPANDPNGISAFYAVISWVFGGYFAATLLGTAVTNRARSRRRAAKRLAGLGIYAVVSGFLSVLIMQTVFEVLDTSFLQLWAASVLTILAAGTATLALQAALGRVGTAVSILLFVIIGNAASGGPYARPLLPGFWNHVGGILPPGAGVDLTRGIAFFDGAATVAPVFILLVWILIGSAVDILLGGRTIDPEEAELEAAAAAAI